MTTVFMFPGQNSRYAGMIDKLTALEPGNRRLVQLASDVLGRDLARHFSTDNPDAFARNRDVQVGVFLASYLHASTLERRGIVADRSVGLSLGEYNHLVDIGALSFEDALTLLEARGDAYDRGPIGRMAAVFPVSLEEADAAVAKSGSPARMAVAMRNTPQQQVLSGDGGPVAAAVRILEDECLAHHVVIESRLPMHSPLFTSVAEAYRPALQRIAWRPPSRPYLPNLTGRSVTDPTPADFADVLSRQISEPVLWRQSIDELAALESPVFVEVGPGEVLFNMLGPRWIRRPRFKTDARSEFAASLDRTVADLSHGC